MKPAVPSNLIAAANAALLGRKLKWCCPSCGLQYADPDHGTDTYAVCSAGYLLSGELDSIGSGCGTMIIFSPDGIARAARESDRALLKSKKWYEEFCGQHDQIVSKLIG